MGTWNVRSMNQGKQEVVKQEMARVNIDILGISELKCTGMGEFNSDDHYICYCGQESLRRSSPHSQQGSKMQYLGATSKKTEGSLFPKPVPIISVRYSLYKPCYNVMPLSFIPLSGLKSRCSPGICFSLNEIFISSEAL